MTLGDLYGLTIILKDIIVYQTFFNIEILLMLFQIYLVDHINFPPDLLICVLNYDKDPPKTELFLKCLSESIRLTCEEILNLVSSKNKSKMFCAYKLKNKISGILRHSKYIYKLSRTKCSVCEKKNI